MQVELVNRNGPYMDGKWQKLDLEYTRDGTKTKKTLVAIGDTKQVIQKIMQLSVPSMIEVKQEKNAKGYWDWKDVSTVSGTTVSGTGRTQVRSTYETPEERARRQVYIIKQSSLSTAVEYHSAKGGMAKVTPDDIIETAQKFVDYVFGTERVDVTEPVKSISDELQDDVPF